MVFPSYNFCSEWFVLRCYFKEFDCDDISGMKCWLRSQFCRLSSAVSMLRGRGSLAHLLLRSLGAKPPTIFFWCIALSTIFAKQKMCFKDRKSNALALGGQCFGAGKWGFARKTVGKLTPWRCSSSATVLKPMQKCKTNRAGKSRKTMVLLSWHHGDTKQSPYSSFLLCE